VLLARTQRLGLFYDRRFDCQSAGAKNEHYQAKLEMVSPHSAAVEAIPDGARVLDLGCAVGYVGATLRQRRRCHVTGVDKFPLAPDIELDAFLLHDLNDGVPPLDFRKYDYVLLLDVIEHLASPEDFVDQLRTALRFSPSTTLLVSTANIGFFINRLMLLIGQFNYGKRGILDLTHSRLFTFSSFRRLFEQGGFRVRQVRGIPGPFALVFGEGRLGRLTMAVNMALVRFARRLFSYQMFFVVEPLPSLEYLLQNAHDESAMRIGKRRAAN
jgi:2-polyprenyl-3-methyl-5-hydroxy-6-metoxy-1,4-benzoquinol methylase